MGCRNMNNGSPTRQNGSSGSTANNQNSDKATLYAKIQELRFVKTELELYLDTHPECKVALDYYNQTVSALEDLYARYSAYGDPMVAAMVQGDEWTWVNNPWPWHRHINNENGTEE